MIDKNNHFKSGHLFMVGLPGPKLDNSTLGLINELKIHNFILFRRNVKDKNQLKGLCTDLINACMEKGLPRPLISIDQEGGQVARLPEPFTQFPDPRQIAEGKECKQQLKEYGETCARELLEVGINMNLAPVLDVSPAERGLFMERRCLGGDPDTVSNLGLLVINSMQQAGLAACAKHFPGLGSAVLDPHLELPTVELGMDYFESCEFIPFKKACQEGVASVMTSHALYSSLDSSLPGTLSKTIIDGMLRKGCNYQGLIVTDDLEMGAIENFMEFSMAAMMSLMAGADLLLICHDHGKVRRAYEKIYKGLCDGAISSEQVDKSLQRQALLLQNLTQGWGGISPDAGLG